MYIYVLSTLFENKWYKNKKEDTNNKTENKDVTNFWFDDIPIKNNDPLVQSHIRRVSKNGRFGIDGMAENVNRSKGCIATIINKRRRL